MARVVISLAIVYLLQNFPKPCFANSNASGNARRGKLFSFLQVIRFPNEGCSGNGGMNGTCFTSVECSQKGGASAGACAQGFGVCCVFSGSCGTTSNHNCTYFTSATQPNEGTCSLRICPLNSNICQLRLDFMSFSIAGPLRQDGTLATFPTLQGVVVPTGTTNAIQETIATQCATDAFSVTNPGGTGPSTICGVNSGEHMYVDSSADCNDLVFELGSDDAATRQWNIKITQYTCDYSNLAPAGCTQYYFGPTTGEVQTFNFNNGQGYHLANQDQTICVSVCWNIPAIGILSVTGEASAVANAFDCCGYGMTTGAEGGFDCIVFIGAMDKTTNLAIGPQVCGSMTTGAGGGTVCSRVAPFSVRFLSDGFERAAGAANPENTNQQGVALTYTLDCP